MLCQYHDLQWRAQYHTHWGQLYPVSKYQQFHRDMASSNSTISSFYCEEEKLDMQLCFPFSGKTNPRFALRYLRWRVETKVKAPIVCTIEECIDLCSHGVWKSNTIQSKEDLIVISKNSSPTISCPSTWPIMTKICEKFMPTSLCRQRRVQMHCSLLHN